MAVKIARDSFYGGSGDANPIDTLRRAVAQANLAIYEAGAGKTGRDHMGTTLTAAVLFNHRVVVGHVGDSRCYLVQGNGIRQISRDHSWVAEEVEAGRMTPEQARVNPRRNIITRALGLRPDVDVDAYEAALEPGSTVVICSDGLHGLVSEDEIISYVRRLPPADAVDALVRLANDRGGPDNISVVVARVMGNGADEADTERGFPVLSEEMMATARADFSDLQAPSVFAQPADEPVEAAPAPVAPPPAAPPPATPIGPAASAAPVADLHQEPPTARTPASVPALSQAPGPQRQSSRGGVALLVVLLLLLILGSAIGYLLFRWAGIAG
jgi:protein phosphatase